MGTTPNYAARKSAHFRGPHHRLTRMAHANMNTEVGASPAAKGEPGTGVRAPVVALMVNADTAPVVTYANLPFGVTATEWGTGPAAKGEPGTGVREPVVALMVYAETSSEKTFATKANSPFGLTATAVGANPAVAKGEPGTGVRAPVVLSMVYVETLPMPPSSEIFVT
jgi:hypothetical protein